MSDNMLSRNEFIQTLIQRKSEWLPDIWKKAEVFLKPPKDPKVPPEHGHLLIVRDHNLWDDLQIEVYSFYKLLQDGIPLDDVVSYLSFQSFPWRLQNLTWDQIRNYDIAKDYIIPVLMPTGTHGIARNLGCNLSLPVAGTDIQICLRILKRDANGQVVRIPVTTDISTHWGEDPYKIFRKAYANAPSLAPPVVSPYTSWIYKRTGAVPHQNPVTENAFVVTNMDAYDGAICFTYPGFIMRIQKALRTDAIYIIPLNVNLSLAMPKPSDMSPLELLQIVKALQLGKTEGNLYLTSDILEDDGHGSWRSAVYIPEGE